MLDVALLALVTGSSSDWAQDAPRPNKIVVRAVEVRGEIGWIDDEGRLAHPRSGTIELWTRYHLDWHRQVLAVTDGRWADRVPSPIAWAVVGRVVLDGRDAYVAGGGWDSEPPADLRWVARPVAAVGLTVVSAGDDAPVRDYEVREWDRATPPLEARDGWMVTPKSEGGFALPAWSLDPDPEPLTGFTWTPRRSFWVRAPYRAWARVEPDFARGGDVVARLVSAGALRVRMSSATKPKLVGVGRPCLEFDFGGTLVRKLVDTNRDDVGLELEGLTPGSLTLRWVDAMESPPRVLVETIIRVEAARTLVLEF